MNTTKVESCDAVAGQVDRPVRPVSEARWYCLDRDGVAMLCKDKADALEQVIENDDCWPSRAPHRAALLGDVAALAAENAALKREAHTWWTACRDTTQELERVRAEASALRALWNEAEAENNSLKGVAHG